MASARPETGRGDKGQQELIAQVTPSRREEEVERRMGEVQSCLSCESKRTSTSSKRIPATENARSSWPGADRDSPVDSPKSQKNIKLGTAQRTSSSNSLEKVGIGAYFKRGMDNDVEVLEIKTFLKGSPADVCNDISVGDIIVAVEGKSVEGISLAELAERLLGPPGSQVTCSFKKRCMQLPSS
ncbi:hypothetical protein GUITHDRAFT_113554 [Guillardia theta CCMP2712]|uniref:PDZ domain-containing protein n=1 Tax=Guillardia theta (strain CCMP2712) TaxID=905079 RepID=L1IWT4_GUITC|nr:hypothetical protein GUITHDRAFT_113554 [Guillardia theta CCMP2712]EKX40314.1 hypothetical protein GUITHDRAFT_113554 [Guillardia theta CCMP2712]|eukprot:XP_005827294.1 hypothetical protein GUITHDRAFT_113554 [Guillardia theta CCMP2712]